MGLIYNIKPTIEDHEFLKLNLKLYFKTGCQTKILKDQVCFKLLLGLPVWENILSISPILLFQDL